MLPDRAPWKPVDTLAIGIHVAQLLAVDPSTLRMADVMRATLPSATVAFLLDDSDSLFATSVTGQLMDVVPNALPDAELRTLLDRAQHIGERRSLVGDSSPLGSNAWAVAGSRTADGRAILANDMHLHLWVPNSLYRAELAYNDVRVAGTIVPGLPVFLPGATDRVAWGVTRLVGNNVDLVQISDDQPVEVRRERIWVREGSSVDIDVEETPWGPVVGRDGSGRRLALRWVTLQVGGFDLGLLDIVEAANIGEASAVARNSGLATLNVLLADADGRVGWAVAGRYPNRTDLGVPPRIVRPDEAGPSWKGYLSAAELPAYAEPDRAFVVNANNANPEHGVRVGVNFFPGARARRIADRLEAADIVDERLCFEIQHDVDASFYSFYRDLVLEVTKPCPSIFREVREAVDAWDSTASVDAPGLAVLVAFREAVRDALLSCLLAASAQADPTFSYVWHNHEGPLRAMLQCTPPLVPPPFGSRKEFFLVCLLGARRAVAADGPLGTWGETNRALIPHMLAGVDSEARDRERRPLPGCAESVCVNWPGFGAAVRLVVSPRNAADGLMTVPGGQSEDISSPHYDDHYEAWCKGEPRPFAACPVAFEAQ